MPDHINDEIPLEQLLIFEDGELVFDGSDPDTYVVLEPGMSIAEIVEQLASEEHARPGSPDYERARQDPPLSPPSTASIRRSCRAALSARAGTPPPNTPIPRAATRAAWSSAPGPSSWTSSTTGATPRTPTAPACASSPRARTRPSTRDNTPAAGEQARHRAAPAA
jgi:hypothetical protein